MPVSEGFFFQLSQYLRKESIKIIVVKSNMECILSIAYQVKFSDNGITSLNLRLISWGFCTVSVKQLVC